MAFQYAGDPLATTPRHAPRQAEQRTAVTGFVSHSRPAPAAFDDTVWVILPDASGDRPYGPCGWPAIHGNTKPVAGTFVTVLFDQDHVPKIVWWEGAHS